MDMITTHHELGKYVLFPPVTTKEEFIEFYHKNVASVPGECLWAIIDKAAPSDQESPDRNYAGTMAMQSTSPTHASTEVGVFVFPAFQRTHVATNAIGLVLLYTLDPPSQGGLGLRRVEWLTHSENVASRRTATRMGFEFEGIARWHRAFTSVDGKVGAPVEELEKRNGTTGEAPGRHTACYAVCWDEWDGKRVKVLGLMEGKR